MALYLARAKASHDFMLNLVERPEDRLATATKLLEGIGGQLHHYYFCFGEYDIVLIYELPDNSKAASTRSTSSATVVTPPMLTDGSGSGHRIHGPGW